MFLELLHNFAEIGSITNFITFAVTILGAISLLFVNMGRYFQAKKFGIPLRNVHQANIAESAELWIALAGSFGFGIFVPIILLGVGWGWWLVAPIIFFSFTMGKIMTKSGQTIYAEKTVTRDGKEYKIIFDKTLIYYTIRSIFATIGYLYLRHAYNNIFAIGVLPILLTAVAAIPLLYYLYNLMTLLGKGLRGRLFGGNEIMTAEIDGQNYFVSMRHSQYQWFLMQYELEEKLSKQKKLRIGKWVNYRWVDMTILVKFTKDNFIIRDLSELEGSLKSIKITKIVDKSKRGRFTYETEIAPSAAPDESSPGGTS